MGPIGNQGPEHRRAQTAHCRGQTGSGMSPRLASDQCTEGLFLRPRSLPRALGPWVLLGPTSADWAWLQSCQEWVSGTWVRADVEGGE